MSTRKPKRRSRSKAPLTLVPFDAARHAGDDEAIVECMTGILESDTVDLLTLALGDITRAKGTAQVAKAAGRGRERLFQALAPAAKSRSTR